MDGKGEKVKEENNFNKNLKALSGFEYNNLRKKLEDLKELREFTFTQGKDNLDINIIKKRNLKKMYQDPIKELEKNLEYFKDFTRYPVLFFYGFGNGILYKILLQNQALKRIIIFEKELELIFLALNFIDFSKDLSLGRLIILHHDDINLPKMDKVFRLIGDLFYRSYNLHIANDFYEHYKEDILKLNKLNMQTIKNHNLMRGNDPKDAMQGIEQFVYNLPQMITHPSYKELLSKRKGISDTAIIVSTGPSLTKQLPLLKKYASKATIFCADSSYPILAKHGIKPDYVCMLERTEITAEFFNHDFGEFDNGICFIIKSIVHPNAINYLTKKTDNFTIVSTYASFIQYLKLDYFGYFNMGFSVAHMACYLSLHLNHKNIIFIGQDLAYAENGNSHPDDYQNSANYENQMYEHILTEAYGGKEKIKTHHVWLMFKRNLEQDVQKIQKYLDTKVYNCTEGGARIEGTIEKPFLWACENLLDKDLNKPFDFPKFLDKKLAKEKLEKTKKYLQKSILESKEFIKKTQTQLQKLRYTLEKNDKNFQTLEKIKNDLLNLFKEFKKLKLFNELCQAIYFHNECEILKFEVLNTNKQKENLIDFLKIQHNWFIQGLGYLDAQNKTIEKSLENWNFDDIIKK
ncbi:motility associated factor glycosyltransferase family protein [Campylobacter coli]|nr:motility associated factor glycosyltransferase family protein [Campylobacter coli]